MRTKKEMLDNCARYQPYRPVESFILEVLIDIRDALLNPMLEIAEDGSIRRVTPTWGGASVKKANE